MTALGSIASGIGGFLSDAFGKAMEAGTKAYKKIKEAFDEYIGPTWTWLMEKGRDAFSGLMVVAEGAWKGLVILWNEVVMPIWDYLKDTVSLVFAFITGDWGRVTELLTKHWEERIEPTISNLSGIFGDVMDTVRGLAVSAWTWIGDRFNEHIVPLWDGFSEKFSNVLSTVRGYWGTFVTEMGNIFDTLLAPAFDFFGGLISTIVEGLKEIVDLVGKALDAGLDKVMGFGSWAVGGAKNLVGSTQDLVSGTTVGTAVAGGMTQTFNMTFDVSGMTDMTDKRRLAREIGDMIQVELSRSLGGSRTGLF
jgi:hypothetical protein